MNADEKIVYRIDALDRIVFVNEYWHDFAVRNDASDYTADKILNRPIWHFISDHTMRQCYREVIGRVRSNRPAVFNFRCDSADRRRFMAMNITLVGDQVQFETRLLRQERRPSQKILERYGARSNELLVICGWCKKMRVGETVWKEIEHAVEALELFARQHLPRLSHGMCGVCYDSLTTKIREM